MLAQIQLNVLVTHLVKLGTVARVSMLRVDRMSPSIVPGDASVYGFRPQDYKAAFRL